MTSNNDLFKVNLVKDNLGRRSEGIQRMEIWSNIKNIFNISLFLSDCRICGDVLVETAESVICERCMNKVRPAAGWSCSRCDRPLASRQIVCGQCLLKPPQFRKHLAFGFYEGVLREIILLFKYGEILLLKHPLSDWLMELVTLRLQASFDFILCIPADPRRKRRINHTHELTLELSKKMNLPFTDNCLQKIRSTEPQAGLRMKKRLTNLNRAFALKNGEQFSGTRVLLVDDVFTTGTTVAKCAGLLNKAGAEVVVITLAKSRF